MPNWVYNNLTLTGKPEQIAEVKTQLATPFMREYMRWDENSKNFVRFQDLWNGEFSFWNIKSPEDIDWYNTKDNWYGWNISNWGTKWDASNVEMETHDDMLTIRFDTAWSPPVEVLETLSTQHPELGIKLEWEEEQGFGGTIEFAEGSHIEASFYDIPSSHAELIERKGYCYCSMWDDADKPFSDCPAKELDNATIQA